ncbi:carboxypeptidase-like regulatory domain-containing protein, partial [uncultured Porphyromonas sp.]|uniref:carboxypeptidase-like regulatory domain-containing protein n=1 Tax=uncultured Porphyromonas sp. TaxID=159274 RepID=UPI002611A9C1
MERLFSTFIRKALLVMGLLLVALTASAQTTGGAITGTIRNAEGALEGASVFLVKDRETQEIVQFAVSDAAGHFTMSAPAGNYIFGVSYLGYAMHTEEISLTAEPLNLGIITLETSAEELQTVVVRGQIVGVRTQPDGFTVDVHEIRERSNDALDLLKHIPKVQVKGNQLGIIGKEQVLVKIGNVLQRVDASEIAGLLKGYDAGLIDRVEVITQPPLRYDPDGNTAMIILHTSSLFKEYMGGVIGTEGMYANKDNYRYGGYGSLLYNRRGLFASIAPSINFNGSNNLEDVTYEAKDYRYHTYTPSVGRYDYMGVRGTLQYAYGEKSLLGVALSWNRKKYRNLFESQETTTQPDTPERVVENSNGYLATEPRITATAYWEATFGE